MVNNRDRVSQVFAALADKTRRRMLEQLLRSGENRVAELSEPFPITPPAVTKHLHVLEKAHLIRRRRQGRAHYIRANPEGLNEAHSWMQASAAGWKFSLHRLDALIEAKGNKEGQP
jgi:DNA-binding transcriptional ArsR family regulator